MNNHIGSNKRLLFQIHPSSPLRFLKLTQYRKIISIQQMCLRQTVSHPSFIVLLIKYIMLFCSYKLHFDFLK